MPQERTCHHFIGILASEREGGGLLRVRAPVGAERIVVRHRDVTSSGRKRPHALRELKSAAKSARTSVFFFFFSSHGAEPHDFAACA